MKYNNLYAYFQLAATEQRGWGVIFCSSFSKPASTRTTLANLSSAWQLHLKRRAPLNLYYFTSISLIFHF